MAPFSGSGSSRETKMSSETQSESYSLVLVTLGHVQTCFHVPFICSWTGRPEDPVGKASMNVRGVPQLKQETFEMCSEQANGIEPEPTKYLPNGVAKLYGPECGLSSGPALRAFGSRGLGVSTSRGDV
ncbi:hypothetical protein CRG98_043724 [Punica granatum]|uniref:Uncharacterized protein n=1 Tax=Punica granatum TaxID=22663 RepID=A0A2I0HW09_PUNGR|nr:hypothetical protein CRG98_043724 [Punica granatum]